MRVIVVGLGVQGRKRRQFAGSDFVASVDPFVLEADYKDPQDVPLKDYDAVLACTPDEPKIDLLTYFLNNGKHVLVEKPLWSENDEDISCLEKLAREKGVICYTAYNHRFEPHFVRMRDLIASEELGRIYSLRVFYGNGTARLVRDSTWRDRGAGVLPDLGSHLLDTCHFWLGDLQNEGFKIISSNCFENKAPDHVIIASENSNPRIELEMTLLMWRNYFSCDILAEKGSAHIESLCKWGPTTFTRRKRILPSGRPPEESVTLISDDPTWALEYSYFRNLCEGRVKTDLGTDLWIQKTLRKLGKEVLT